jgi:hypothetical protein
LAAISVPHVQSVFFAAPFVGFEQFSRSAFHRAEDFENDTSSAIVPASTIG